MTMIMTKRKRMRNMGIKLSLRDRAERNVLRVRGSYDAPGFDACVAAEMKRLKGSKK